MTKQFGTWQQSGKAEGLGFFCCCCFNCMATVKNWEQFHFAQTKNEVTWKVYIAPNRTFYLVWNIYAMMQNLRHLQPDNNN